MPTRRSAITTTTPAETGTTNWRRRFSGLAFLQAMRGPIPVSATRNSPSGTLTRLKNGGPTVILVPRTASDMIGNSVPQSTENAIPTKARLLKRKAASLLAMDSSRASGSSKGHRTYSSAKERIPARRRKLRK
jgi:hypothetical protein